MDSRGVSSWGRKSIDTALNWCYIPWAIRNADPDSKNGLCADRFGSYGPAEKGVTLPGERDYRAISPAVGSFGKRPEGLGAGRTRSLDAWNEGRLCPGTAAGTSDARVGHPGDGRTDSIRALLRRDRKSVV